MGAQIRFKMEGCARGMGQRGQRNDAALRAAQNKLRKEGYASGTGQRGQKNNAAVRAARNKPKMDMECAFSMGQSVNSAVVKDAQIKLSREECA
jgi:hypothetical protein